jgi:hypothetical protein
VPPETGSLSGCNYGRALYALSAIPREKPSPSFLDSLTMEETFIHAQRLAAMQFMVESGWGSSPQCGVSMGPVQSSVGGYNNQSYKYMCLVRSLGVISPYGYMSPYNVKCINDSIVHYKLKSVGARQPCHCTLSLQIWIQQSQPEQLNDDNSASVHWRKQIDECTP